MQCETTCCEADEGRRFLTTEEKIEKLQKYQDWLKAETEGVQETITKLKKAK